jgi:hypothetical protein
MDAKDIEPVKQVTSKLSFQYGLFGISIGCREQPNINLDFLAAPQTANSALFDNPKQLCLQNGGHFSDFVKQERSGVCQLKAAWPPGCSARKSSLFMAE